MSIRFGLIGYGLIKAALNYNPKSGHMRMAVTISMPDKLGFTMLLEDAATSL